MFCKKGFLENLAKFTGKHLCQCLFFNKVAGLIPATLLKKRLWHRCFPVNFAKFLRTPFIMEHLWWLLLNIYKQTGLYSAHFQFFRIWCRTNFNGYISNYSSIRKDTWQAETQPIYFFIFLTEADTKVRATLAEMFSCESCKISKNTFFTEHFRWLLL